MEGLKLRLLTASSILLLAFVWGCDSGTSGPSNLISVSENSFANLNQCLSASASVVGFSDTQVRFSGNGTLKGSVVLLGKSTLTLSGNAKVTDQVVTPNADQLSLSGNSSAAHVEEEDLTPNEPAVLDFAASLDLLAATETVDGIQGSTTLSGNGGVNVIDVNGDIRLTGNQTLTLQGGSKDLFLINVDGDVAVSGQAQILVSGEMSAANVLFRLTRDGSLISISGNGLVQGTFFAERGSAQVSGNGVIQGSIFAWNFINISGNGLTFSAAPFCPGNFVPAPSPSPSPSASPSPTDTSTASPSPSPTDTSTASPSPSPTDTSTASPSPSPTDTSTASPSPSPSSTSIFSGGGILGT